MTVKETDSASSKANTQSEKTEPTHKDAFGLEYSFTDGGNDKKPKRIPVEGDKLHAWLIKDYDDDYPLQILSRCGSRDEQELMDGKSQLSTFFSADVENEILRSDIQQYHSLQQSLAGGSFCDAEITPYKFVCQTPNDDGPFASMALMTHGRGLVRGFYFFTDDCYDPREILQNYILFSGWRSIGFHILVLPVAFLGAHATRMGLDIAKLHKALAAIEKLLSHAQVANGADFTDATRKLYECSSHLVDLERRAVFNKGLIRTLDQYFEAMNRQKYGNYSSIFKGSMDAHKNMVDAQEYELKAIPRRIKTQQTMVFNLIVQRDMRLNLEIAQTSRQMAEASQAIAEATMNDSASMKTIAILTMLFLPGTAVASFFSMTMFNWNPAPGQRLATSYIWVYFVVATPLTLMTIGIWYICLRRRRRRMSSRPFGASFPSTIQQPSHVGPTPYPYFQKGGLSDVFRQGIQLRNDSKHGHQA